MKRSGWAGAAIAAGVAYVIIGRVFAWPSTHIIAWRDAAWVVSFFVYLAHIRRERVTLGSGGRVLAAHVGLGAALGGLGLAIAAIIYRMQTGVDVPVARWAISLVAWPAIT